GRSGEMKKLMLITLFVTGGLAAGCNKKSDEGSGSSAATAGGGDSVGVAECDDYLKKMESCFAKMPAEAKTAQEQALKASRDAWKSAAASQAGKDALKTTCKAAMDALAQNPMCK